MCNMNTWLSIFIAFSDIWNHYVEMLLTPEESIRCQNNIGADIMMQLDDVVGADTTDDARFLEAMHRSVRWLDRCIAAHSRPKEQNLFAIIQGGLDVRPGGLRDVCLTEMMKRSDKVPGFAIGGLAGGESKEDFWRVVAYVSWIWAVFVWLVLFVNGIWIKNR